MTGTGGIRIRAAEPEDAPAIFQIVSGENLQRGTLQLPYQSLARWKERLSTEQPGFHRLVADLNGTAVGYAGLHVVESPRRSFAFREGAYVDAYCMGRVR